MAVLPSLDAEMVTESMGATVLALNLRFIIFLLLRIRWPLDTCAASSAPVWEELQPRLSRNHNPAAPLVLSCWRCEIAYTESTTQLSTNARKCTRNRSLRGYEQPAEMIPPFDWFDHRAAWFVRPHFIPLIPASQADQQPQ